MTKTAKSLNFIGCKTFFSALQKCIRMKRMFSAAVSNAVFRSRKKFSTTYAIVLFFFCFFFSRPFHENFKFLKNCPYDFHEILHSHSTPKGAPACAKASKSYGLDVKNIAKISPKVAKKQPFFDFFDFLKNCPYDSNEIFYSYSTPY